jgi:beta-galactosidase
VLDKDGNLCPNADNEVQFQVDGEAFIAGVDNGSPMSLERFKADHRKAFNGKCLVVVQNKGRKGRVAVKATSQGLKSGEATLEVK